MNEWNTEEGCAFCWTVVFFSRALLFWRLVSSCPSVLLGGGGIYNLLILVDVPEVYP